MLGGGKCSHTHWSKMSQRWSTWLNQSYCGWKHCNPGRYSSHQDRNVSSEHKGDYSQQLWTDLQSHLPVLETMLTKCTPLYNIWKWLCTNTMCKSWGCTGVKFRHFCGHITFPSVHSWCSISHISTIFLKKCCKASTGTTKVPDPKLEPLMSVVKGRVTIMNSPVTGRWCPHIESKMKSYWNYPNIC